MKKQLLLTLALSGALTLSAQWSSDPAKIYDITPQGGISADYELESAPDGSLRWVYCTSEDTRLQSFDKNGNKKFEEPGLFVTNEPRRSWWAVNQELLIDKDGNSIVVVSDCRNDENATTSGAESGSVHGNLSYTVYKISPTGEMLWGDKGVDLEGGEIFFSEAKMNIIQLSDGSYVFSWCRSRTGEDPYEIKMERLDSKGSFTWEKDLKLTDKEGIMYSWLVDAGMREYIIVYAKGLTQHLMAQKYDFEGNPVWPAPVTVYDQGFPAGGAPIWTYVKVKSDNNGGAFVSWYDSRDNGLSLSYISHITNDGSWGFDSGKDGAVLSTPENMICFQNDFVYDQENEFIYTVHSETDPNQVWDKLVVQKLDKHGDPMWGDEGIDLTELKSDESYGYYSIRMGKDNNPVVFYMYSKALASNSDVDVFAASINAGTGEVMWRTSVTTMPGVKYSLKATQLIDDAYFVLKWDNDKQYFLQPVNVNGALSTDPDIKPVAVKDVVANTGFDISVSDYNLLFNIDTEKASEYSLRIYSVSGVLVDETSGSLSEGRNSISIENNLNDGVWFARLTTGETEKVVKFIVR